MVQSWTERGWDFAWFHQLHVVFLHCLHCNMLPLIPHIIYIIKAAALHDPDKKADTVKEMIVELYWAEYD